MVDPRVLFIAVLIAVSFWVGQKVVAGAKWVGRETADIAQDVGCGLKKAFTSGECQPDDE